MKKTLITFLLITLSLVHAENRSACDKKLEEIKGTSLSDLSLKVIEDIDMRHSYSSTQSSSSGTEKNLDFLRFDTSRCEKSKRKEIEHYWSIVSLFSLNTGKILITENKSKNYDEEIEEYLTEKPFLPSKNEKGTKDNIKNILKYYNSLGEFDKNITINDYNITSLNKKLVNLRNSLSDTDTSAYLDIDLAITSKKLLITLKSETLKDVNSKIEKKSVKKEKTPIIILSDIMKRKKMYNNHSWFAMNFYNKHHQKPLDSNGHLLETAIEYVESELITKDMNDTSKKYYLLKNGKINQDQNRSKKYHYFLAEDGTQNPLHEMEATLHYFFDNPNKTQNRVCKEYPNRYVLLKQLFKGSDTFDKISQEINCSNIPTEIKFYYGYFTTGEESTESFGHSILVIESKGKYTSTKMNNVMDSRYAKNNPKKNITNKITYYLNFAVDNPEVGFLNNLTYNINGMIGNINGKFKKQLSYEINESYLNRMLIKFPITALESDIEKRELLSAQIQHIVNNIDNFEIPYRFMSKNCAYVFANILEVPFPELRDKFNNTGYFTFKPKDIIELMKGKIDVSKHEAIRL